MHPTSARFQQTTALTAPPSNQNHLQHHHFQPNPQPNHQGNHHIEKGWKNKSQHPDPHLLNHHHLQQHQQQPQTQPRVQQGQLLYFSDFDNMLPSVDGDNNDISLPPPQSPQQANPFPFHDTFAPISNTLDGPYHPLSHHHQNQQLQSHSQPQHQTIIQTHGPNSSHQSPQHVLSQYHNQQQSPQHVDFGGIYIDCLNNSSPSPVQSTMNLQHITPQHPQLNQPLHQIHIPQHQQHQQHQQQQPQSKRLPLPHERPGPPNSNVYILNIPINWTALDLTNFFAGFKLDVRSVRIMHDQNGVSKKAGFVRFSSISQASTSIALANGLSVPGNHTPLVARFAHLKSNANTTQVTANLAAVQQQDFSQQDHHLQPQPQPQHRHPQQQQQATQHPQSRIHNNTMAATTINNTTNNNSNNNNNQSIHPQPHFGGNFQAPSSFHPINDDIHVHGDGFHNNHILQHGQNQLSLPKPHQQRQQVVVGGNLPYSPSNTSISAPTSGASTSSHGPYIFNGGNNQFISHGGPMGMVPYPTINAMTLPTTTTADCSDIIFNPSLLTKTHSQLSNSDISIDQSQGATTTINGQNSPSPNHSHVTFSSSNGNVSGPQNHSQSTILGINQGVSQAHSDHNGQRDFSTLTLEDFMMMQQRLQQQQDMISSLLGQSTIPPNPKTA